MAGRTRPRRACAATFTRHGSGPLVTEDPALNFIPAPSRTIANAGGPGRFPRRCIRRRPPRDMRWACRRAVEVLAMDRISIDCRSFPGRICTKYRDEQPADRPGQSDGPTIFFHPGKNGQIVDFFPPRRPASPGAFRNSAPGFLRPVHTRSTLPYGWMTWAHFSLPSGMNCERRSA